MNRFFQALLGEVPRRQPSRAHSPFGAPAHGDVRLRARLEPVRNRPPTPRPDFVVSQGPKTVAILDAKYRDLWENPLPRDMLYQLAIYAMSHESGRPRSCTLRTHDQATEARIDVRDPLHGGRRALVVLRRSPWAG